MKFTYAMIAVAAMLGSSSSQADSRNPFDPASARPVTHVSATSPGKKSETAVAQPSTPVAPRLPPDLPPIMPPPLPPKAPPPASEAAPAKAKPKESPMRMTAASCQLKPKSESVAAPAFGGIVTVSLQGGRDNCVSAVLVEESWLEVKDLSDPSAIKLVVDANDTNMPRQSNVVIANAGQSVTVTLVQEGRNRNR